MSKVIQWFAQRRKALTAVAAATIPVAGYYIHNIVWFTFYVAVLGAWGVHTVTNDTSSVPTAPKVKQQDAPVPAAAPVPYPGA